MTIFLGDIPLDSLSLWHKSAEYLALFSKREKTKERKEKSKTRQRIEGGLQVGTGSLLAKQGIDSGLPRLMGVRLERHGTSKKAARQILSEVPEAKGRYGFLKPSLGGTNPEGIIVGMGFDRYGKDPVLKALGKGSDEEYQELYNFFASTLGGFQERARRHSFISGRNPNHPDWKGQQSILDSIKNVLLRKTQVAGYRGVKSGPVTDKDREQLGKILKTAGRRIKVADPTNKASRIPLKEAVYKQLLTQTDTPNDPLVQKHLKDLTDTMFGDAPLPKIGDRVKSAKQLAALSNLGQTRLGKRTFRLYGINDAFENYLQKKGLLQEGEKVSAYGRNSTTGAGRVTLKGSDGGLRRVLPLSPKEMKKIAGNSLQRFVASASGGDYLWDPKRVMQNAKDMGYEDYFTPDEIKNRLDRVAKLRLKATKDVTKHLITEPFANLTGQAFKLGKGVPAGLLGIHGKEMFVPGSDDYFNDTKRFKFDPDDPFGPPTFLGRGNALKTTEKVKVYRNRHRAALDYLKDYNPKQSRLKNLKELAKANPKRIAAGAALLGVGGLGAALAGKGVKTIAKTVNQPKENKSKKDKVLVKGHTRNGKQINNFWRRIRNPFSKDK